nr:uncharacterized protein LOC114825565 [Malus domestica]
MPYLKGYETLNLVFFDGMNGSLKEHISCFIDALGPHADDCNLRLREFLKTLTDRAYTWYTTLAPGSIQTWKELACKFCKKYFKHKEMVMTTQLNNTRQKYEEDLVTFVKHFADIALDYYGENDEEALVEICINNIVVDYRVYLKNISISQFLRLLEAVKNTSLSIKPSTGKSWKTYKKEAHHTLSMNDRFDYNPRKMKEIKSDRETYPPLACNNEEFQAILDTMLADGTIKVPRSYKSPSKEDRKDPKYCRYHQYVGHPYIVCQTLRRILHAKICEGTLELSCKTQAINTDPLPKR